MEEPHHLGSRAAVAPAVSITHTERVTCRCGVAVDVFVADSLNAARHPHLRQLVFDRKLHVFTCAACGHEFVVEQEMLYFDFNRRQFIGVFPTSERHRERECGQQLLSAFDATIREQAPEFVRGSSRDFLVRIVFGYEELREKLAIDNAQLSDLVIEFLKCDVMASDGTLMDDGVLTLRFDHISDDGSLYFLTESADGGVPAEPVILERSLYDALAARADVLVADTRGIASGPHCSLLRLIDWSRDRQNVGSGLPK